ncbi:DUF4350 domain-containing protein, partial [Micromonospora deserti]
TTLVTHAVDQPDPTDRGFLSPLATGDNGGSRLAGALRERGVIVQRETDTRGALAATRAAPATLFVPAPALLRAETAGALGALPARTRLVLVDPPRRVLAAAGLPLAPAGRRWAARALAPDARGLACSLPELAAAGVAAVHLQRYAVAPGRSVAADFCYADAVARLPGAAETVVVGATDPFRNDRIDEWANRAFASGLLAGPGRVVWLDLDGPEPAPPGGGSTGSSTRPGAPGDSTGYGGPGGGRPGSGDGDGRGGPGRPGDSDRPSGSDRDDSAGSADPPNPLWSAFPSWFWALLVQLALAALLMAAWRARRLGPPTPEPLPVAVRSAETVLGRARLYQRSGARAAAARTLRDAALARLLPRLNLPGTTPPGEVAAAVAARTGEGPDATGDLLYGDAPESDRDLLDLARGLDRVTRTVAPPPGTGPDAPDAPHPHPEGDPR